MVFVMEDLWWARYFPQIHFVVFIVLLLNILGLLIYYSIPYIIAIGMGVTDLNFISMLVATTYVMMIGSFVPIPGGTGGIEYGFVHFSSHRYCDFIQKTTTLIYTVNLIFSNYIKLRK